MSNFTTPTKPYKIVIFATCLFLLAITGIEAQVGIGTTTPSSKLEVVGAGTTSATTSLKVGNASSTILTVRNDGLVEVSSTTQGFLPPRMTYAQREAIASPATGLMVYCSNCGPGTGEPQFYNGSAWVNMIGGIALTQPPSIASTTSATNITKTSATSGGNITTDFGNAITARGVCWSTSSNPTTAGSKTTESGTTGSFSSNITGLTGGTTYYVRAYATNASGTGYGNEVSVRTADYDPPVIAATSTPTIIRGYNATSGGNVIESDAPVTARGICWSTSSNPTISLATKTIESGNTGQFSSTLSGLVPNTPYYVRSYATSSAGTSYGAETSFIAASLEDRVYGFECCGSFALTNTGVTFDETVWRSSGTWNDIRNYGGTVFAGTYSWNVSFSSPSATVQLSNSYDFDAVSIYARKESGSNATQVTITCYDNNNQQVGTAITSAISTSYSQISINRNRIRKIVFSQNGSPTAPFSSDLYFDNLSFRQ